MTRTSGIAPPVQIHFLFREVAPPYIDEEGFNYCRGCIEDLFRPIASGDETGGLPRIQETVLSEVPRVVEGIDPELREHFAAGLVRSQETAA